MIKLMYFVYNTLLIKFTFCRYVSCPTWNWRAQSWWEAVTHCLLTHEDWTKVVTGFDWRASCLLKGMYNNILINVIIIKIISQSSVNYTIHSFHIHAQCTCKLFYMNVSLLNFINQEKGNITGKHKFNWSFSSDPHK